ncbi:MAG: uracil-DNA glycosylase [Planctomycetes bacterium]|nr:uracil-DNA glycosylase [Planctomycetota bacterium]
MLARSRAVKPDELDNAEAVHCTRCVHYWITHERSHPHACRAFGIKSSRLPMLEVRAASGSECQGFEPKHPAPHPR